MIRLTGTHRLVPSRYPPVGLLDAVAGKEDLEAIFELEGWTNDRISTELGILNRIPKEEWVVGRPMSSVIMAAFCHPRPGGGRFNSAERGAWYAARSLATAQAEIAYHRTQELAEVGVFETRIEMRLYLADFHADLYDIRANVPKNKPYHDPTSYRASQELAERLLNDGADGVLYRSVRHTGGECLACFRPRLIGRVRVAGHYEFRWTGEPKPTVRRLSSP